MKLDGKKQRAVFTALREVETNRLVRIMDAADRKLYRVLLSRHETPDAKGGIVPGNLWGESALVYLAKNVAPRPG